MIIRVSFFVFSVISSSHLQMPRKMKIFNLCSLISSPVQVFRTPQWKMSHSLCWSAWEESISVLKSGFLGHLFAVWIHSQEQRKLFHIRGAFLSFEGGWLLKNVFSSWIGSSFWFPLLNVRTYFQFNHFLPPEHLHSWCSMQRWSNYQQG